MSRIAMRTAFAEGTVKGVAIEDPQTKAVTAQLNFPTIQAMAADLNVLGVPFYDDAFTLRAADYRWLGKRARITVSIEVFD